ncbi:hypothetical protein MPS_3753 [Mycobacterium pseudoshottsii JCM 15466]|nr:hypothetical protein MPS_3753 [Mycobacterium pseudoshottsii JCM 15466]
MVDVVVVVVVVVVVALESRVQGGQCWVLKAASLGLIWTTWGPVPAPLAMTSSRVPPTPLSRSQ